MECLLVSVKGTHKYNTIKLYKINLGNTMNEAHINSLLCDIPTDVD